MLHVWAVRRARNRHALLKLRYCQRLYKLSTEIHRIASTGARLPNLLMAHVTQGGDAPNVIPAHTSARYIVRGRTIEELEELRPKVHRCFEAGALATGAQLEIVGGNKPYAEMLHDLDMATIYRRNAETLGRTFPDPATERTSGSTDMGNVSLALPSIHPMIGIDSLPAVNHQPEFTAHCITAAADNAVIDGSLAMAWTAIDIAADDSLRQRLMARA